MHHREREGHERQGYDRREDYRHERSGRDLGRPEFNRGWDEQGMNRPGRYWGRERQDWQQPGYGQRREHDLDRDWEHQDPNGYGNERPYQEWEQQGYGYRGQDDRGSRSYGFGSQQRQGYPDEDTGYSSSGFGGPLFGSRAVGRYGQNRQGRGQYSNSYEDQASQWEGQRGPHAGRRPKGYQRSDERIREDICDRLTEHPAIDASEIDVEVKGCEVTLKGTVESRSVKHLVETMTETVPGVREIHNQLRVGWQQQSRQPQANQ